jgi:hypothetical protein
MYKERENYRFYEKRRREIFTSVRKGKKLKENDDNNSNSTEKNKKRN